MKPSTTKRDSARWRSSSSSTSSVGMGAANQLSGAADCAIDTGGSAITVTGTRSVTMVPGSTSLKRLVQQSRVHKLGHCSYLFMQCKANRHSVVRYGVVLEDAVVSCMSMQVMLYCCECCLSLGCFHVFVRRGLRYLDGGYTSPPTEGASSQCLGSRTA